jgi:thiamine biosynthesis lipoprotein
MTQVRPRMGTLLALSLPDDAIDARRWAAIVFDTAAACEHVMSRHDRSGDLGHLNRLAGCGTFLHAPELARILRSARRWAERTGGGFDPTVAPLLDAWRRAGRRGQAPAPTTVRMARQLLGWRTIDVRGDQVRLLRAGATLDLGGFGKGVALDRIARALRRERCPGALLNFGESSLMAIGGPWRVVLRHPDRGFAGEFSLRDRACSTSGTLGRTLGRGRGRVSHVLDPRRGRPLRRHAQVTVLARSAAAAEALSTALLVLGRPGLAPVMRRFDVDVCWIDGAGTWLSPRFPLAA